jgi:uncharacterized SAM-binding protein YcdF (DUF218 family)
MKKIEPSLRSQNKREQLEQPNPGRARFPWRRVARWSCYAALGLGVLVGLCFIGCPLAGAWLSLPSQPTPADAIVVFGGSRNRTQQGIELFEQGLAPELWHTGWSEPATPPSRREQLAAKTDGGHRLPEHAIHLLETTSTWEDGREVARLAQQQGVQHLLVVTDWHHSRRAVCMLRHHLRESSITVSFASALDTPGHIATWWQHKHTRHLVISEWQKLLYYWVRYGVPTWTC